MIYADRIKDTTTTTGTGNVTVSGTPPTRYRALSTIATGSVRVPLLIEGQSGTEWELAECTILSATTFSRDVVLSSSNSGAKVNFSAGTKDVFCAMSAGLLSQSLVNSEDVGYDIVLCAGQSNMEGNPTWDQYVDVYDPRLLQFGGSSADANTYRKIVAGSDPMLMYDGARTGKISPCTWFGKAYANTLPSNRRVLLVPVAEGSTGLVRGTPEWGPGSPGGLLYELAITQTNLAIAAALLIYPHSRFVGAIWEQGESDASSGITQAAYVTALKALIAGWRSRITGASSSWFVIGGMVPEKIAANPSTYGVIDLAHKQVPTEVDKVLFVAGPSGYDNDVHYTAPGVRIIGTNMGLGVRAASVAVGADTTAPTASSAAVANATPTVVNITMSEAMDTGYVPATSAFTVGGHTVSSVGVSGSTINLTCSAAFVYGEAARTVAYTQPGANNARDVAGNLLANFSSLSITNNVVAAASAITMTGPSSGTVSVASTNFSVGVSPVGGTITGTVVVTPADGGAGGTFTPTTVSLTTASPTSTFTYTPASTGAKTISATNSGSLSNPANLTYTSNSGDVTAPSFSSAQVANATPTVINITMDETLAAFTPATSAFTASGGKTVTNVAVSGTSVDVTVNTAYVNGDTITVTYTKPGSNMLQDAAGNQTATFGPSSVTNNISPASYATWNPSDKGTGITLSSGNLVMTGTTGNHASARATIGKSTGKWYWEVTLTTGDTCMAGIGKTTANIESFPGSDANGYGYYYTGVKFTGGSSASYGATFAAGDVIGVALNMDAGTLTFYKNGVSQGTAYTGLSGTFYPMCSVNTNTFKWTADFGATTFAYTPPSGHVGLS